jgi:hypothetical protein
MAKMTRFMAPVLAVVACALTILGVVLAATDSNPAGLVKDPLTLNGYPPKTADLEVTLTSGAGVRLTSNLEVNFTSDRAEADVSFPLVVTSAEIDLRLVKGHLYARAADQASGPWLVTALTIPSLFGVSLEMTRPDVDLISGFHKSIVRSGYSTIYTFFRRGVALSKLFGSKSSTSTLGSVHWSITVGSQGELTASTLREKSAKGVMTLAVTVLSYNQPTQISVPLRANTEPLGGKGLKELLRSEEFTSLLFPKSLTSLSGTSVS